jgi:aerobic-type carbon monoxide dehydrogenase small subunit (CoxS/CutS family)
MSESKKEGSITNEKQCIMLTVNGDTYELPVGDAYCGVCPSDTLLHTLRETLGLKGTKEGCNHGGCGACTVIMDGKPIMSCMTLTVECNGKNILTIEGLENRKTGQLHPLQEAFIKHTAFQCGFCTPGILMSAKVLLDNNPNPEEEDIKQALSGHYCRCISHYQVVKAVTDVVQKGGENG